MSASNDISLIGSLTTAQVALADAEATLDNGLEPLAFYQNVSPNKELRDASNVAEALVREYCVEASMRLDVYQAKLAAQKVIRKTWDMWSRMTEEQKRLIDKMVGLSLLCFSSCIHQDLTRFSMVPVQVSLFPKRREQNCPPSRRNFPLVVSNST